MYRQPRVTLASSSVCTLETLHGPRRRANLVDLVETYYARRLCISVIAGIALAFENGFHRMIISHQPEIVSPKFRGELSSSLKSVCMRIGYRRVDNLLPSPHRTL